MRDYIAVRERRPPILSRLPPQIGYFLGVRGPDSPRIFPNPPEWARLVQVLLVTYGALVVQAAINKYGYPFKQWNAPALVPSFGASAVLCFNATASPLAQPRNLALGSMIATLIGIALMKFWMTSASNEQYLWLGAPLSCGITSVLLSIFQCIHPPVGATAMLPLLDDQIRQLGWKYFVVELQGVAVFLAFACLFDNILARYPTHWWQPVKQKTLDITPKGFNTTVAANDEMLKHIEALQTLLTTADFK